MFETDASSASQVHLRTHWTHPLKSIEDLFVTSSRISFDEWKGLTSPEGSDGRCAFKDSKSTFNFGKVQHKTEGNSCQDGKAAFRAMATLNDSISAVQIKGRRGAGGIMSWHDFAALDEKPQSNSRKFNPCDFKALNISGPWYTENIRIPDCFKSNWSASDQIGKHLRVEKGEMTQNLFDIKMAAAHAGSHTDTHRDSYGLSTWIKCLQGEQLVLCWSLDDGQEFGLTEETTSWGHTASAFPWNAFVRLPSASICVLRPGDFFFMRSGTYHRVLTLSAKLQIYGEYLDGQHMEMAMASVRLDMDMETDNTDVRLSKIFLSGLIYEAERRMGCVPARDDVQYWRLVKQAFDASPAWGGKGIKSGIATERSVLDELRRMQPEVKNIVSAQLLNGRPLDKVISELVAIEHTDSERRGEGGEGASGRDGGSSGAGKHKPQWLPGVQGRIDSAVDAASRNSELKDANEATVLKTIAEGFEHPD
jgi:hypothetical protein